jgi:hypothetical protein
MPEEDVSLRLRIALDGGSRQALHQCEHRVGVARFGAADVQRIAL